MSAEILSQIEDVLDKIRPALHADGGDVELVEFDEEGFVYLDMQGSCGGCPMSTATLTLGIEAELRRAIPEVEGVITVWGFCPFRRPSPPKAVTPVRIGPRPGARWPPAGPKEAGVGCPRAPRLQRRRDRLRSHPPQDGGVWRSLVARSVRVGEVPGSNPGTPIAP